MVDVTIHATGDVTLTDRLSNATEAYVQLLRVYQRVRPYASPPVLGALSAALALALDSLETAKTEARDLLSTEVKEGDATRG